MPNNSVLEKKKAYVDELAEKLTGAASIVVVDYKGISVADDTKLRRELREANVEYFVVKNTLLRFAAEKLGLNELDSYLNGTTAVAVSKDDAVAPARILAKQADAEDSAFTLKAGYIEGKFTETDELKAIAKLPTREVLIAQVLAGLNAPITGLAMTLNAIAEKQGA